MAYRFKLKETFGKGFRRIAREELRMIDAALLEAIEGPESADPQIHGARRGLKRLRSLLRLARGETTTKSWRQLDRELSDIGRLLSGRRDLAVMLETLAELEAEGGISAETSESVRASIETKRADLHIGEAAEAVECARDALAMVEARLRRLTVRHHPPAEAAGLEDTYRRARKAYHHAYGEAVEPEAFHDLRKAVQRHWRHLQLVSRAWPEVIDARIATARECSRLLGLEQDLAILAEYVEQQYGPKRQSKSRALRLEVVGACRAKQVALREAVEPLLARLFAERARSHARTLAQLWSAARRMHLAVAMDRETEAGRAIDAA
jgi:hypothetical protein